MNKRSDINSNIKIIQYETREALFSAVAKTCEVGLSNSIKNFGSASFIIPGGTTPAPAFQILSKTSLDWEKVTIAQSDERWVESNHPQSNQLLTEKNLLINLASQSKYIPMKNKNGSAKDGLVQCNKAYQNMLSPFTITMLGMGLDGHVASLFPGSKTIEHALDLANENLCIDIDAIGCPVAGEYTERMSLTLSAILNSQQIIILVTGKDKLQLINESIARSGKGDLAINHLVSQQKTPVNIYWAE